MKVRLCNKDVCNLVDMLRELPETLENLGVVGDGSITVGKAGDINGVFGVSPTTSLHLTIEDGGDKGAWQYVDD